MVLHIHYGKAETRSRVKEGLYMNRTDIAKAISEDLLDNGALDEHNFGDTDTLLKCVQDIILEHMKDYIILSGTIL